MRSYIHYVFNVAGYVNDTLNQIIPYNVGNEMSEIKCPRPHQNFTFEICLGDARCLYDLFTTEDVGVAKNTWDSYQRYSASMTEISKGRIQCCSHCIFLYNISAK